MPAPPRQQDHDLEERTTRKSSQPCLVRPFKSFLMSSTTALHSSAELHWLDSNNGGTPVSWSLSSLKVRRCNKMKLVTVKASAYANSIHCVAPDSSVSGETKKTAADDSRTRSFKLR